MFKKLKRNIREEVKVRFIVTYNTTEAFLQVQMILSSHTNDEGVNYLTDLLNIHYNSAEREIDKKSFDINIVKENICIIDKARGWGILLFKEGIKIAENFQHFGRIKVVFNSFNKQSHYNRLISIIHL